MKADTVFLAVFTGTGNSLVAAEAVAETLRSAGKTVTLVSMDKSANLAKAGIRPGDALGIITPVACFTTYPTAWRFMLALPDGGGRETFFLATMGGAGGRMQQPIGRLLQRKNYLLTGAACIRAPGNYGANTPDEAARPALLAAVSERASAFAQTVLAGTATWNAGWHPLAWLAVWAGRHRYLFRLFQTVFNLQVSAEKCTGCGLCARLCPEDAIAMKKGTAVIDTEECESCQRCIAFCPAGAIGAPYKKMRPYRAVTPERMREFLARE